jgi:histone H3/H4
MKKSNKKDNGLLKTNRLVKLVKTIGIKRISPEALNLLNNEIRDYITEIIAKSRENMIINGRKTLAEDDIRKSINKTEKLDFEI